MTNSNNEIEQYVSNIKKSKKTIYDPIKIGDPDLWIPTPTLEQLLTAELKGSSVAGLSIRTRSKVVKEMVCQALGYPIPASFRRTQPKFLGQGFDTYVQKKNNLQVWNEKLSPTRRYVLIRVEGEVITKVKVVTGVTLAELDTTGKLTQKYQASLKPNDAETELISSSDTDLLLPFVKIGVDLKKVSSPISHPQAGELLPIKLVFERLISLVGRKFNDSGFDQERKRGAELHKLVCKQLGYKDYRDDGQFPDVRHQLLEVKLQTSPTIDLGLVCPDSKEALDGLQIKGKQIRPCDVRYAIFFAITDGQTVTLKKLYLTTGEMFFSRFPQFQGKVKNKKLQIRLPTDFFNGETE